MAPLLALVVLAPPAGPRDAVEVIRASATETWAAFATTAGRKAWNPGESDVDLRIGGLIRENPRKGGKLGEAGTTETTILAFDPERMLAFRDAKATATVWSVVYLSPAGDGWTRVTWRTLGADAAKENATALTRLRKSFERRPKKPS